MNDLTDIKIQNLDERISGLQKLVIWINGILLSVVMAISGYVFNRTLEHERTGFHVVYSSDISEIKESLRQMEKRLEVLQNESAIRSVN